MTRAIVALLALGWAASAHAHSRSVSYSTWNWRGAEAEVEVQLDGRNVAELIVGPGLERGAIGPEEWRRVRHLAPRLVADGLDVRQGGQACVVRVLDTVARPAREMLRIGAHIECPGTSAPEVRAAFFSGQFFTGQSLAHTHLMTVRVDGGPTTRVALGAWNPVWQAKTSTARADWAKASFIGSGLTHIFTGYDHLAFIGVMLLVVTALGRRRTVRQHIRALLVPVSAFTIGHSVTLALASFGTARPDEPTIELLIAASVLVLAFEGFVAAGRAGVATRAVFAASLLALPIAAGTDAVDHSALALGGFALLAIAWLEATHRRPDRAGQRAAVALVFGLVHGFGFAGALTEFGLQGADLAVALLSFNVGVELGQAVVLAALLLPVLALYRRIGPALALQAGSGATVLIAAWWIGTRAVVG